MTTIVIMPGGFHPFHAGHYALYQSAQRAFPDADVYVAATNDTSARPFPFPVKEKLAKLAGVEAGHFVQVKSPFRAEEITAKFDPARDTLIFVRSEKDSTKPPQPGGVKKDGSASYLQPLLGAKKLEPFARHAYMAYLPTVEFGPGMTSATEIRAEWPTLDEQGKLDRVMGLYPRTQGNAKLAATVVKLLDAAIGTQGVAEGSLNEFAPGAGDEDGGEDPYKYPKPKRYARSADYFGQFEAGHFDRENFDDATGVFKGYWGRIPIAYFKFTNPTKTGSEDPGMGWYYEPESNSNSNTASAAPAVDRSAERKQQELGMIDAFLKSGQTPKPGSQIYSMMKRHGLAEGKVINTYLWHGSRQKIPMLEPRQAVDTGGAAGSNQNAIYATSDPIFAIQMGMPTAGSDYGNFPNDPQMVLFSGKIRKGEYVYLHKLPFNGPDGKPQFVQGGNSREFHSIPGVEGIKPIEIKEIPVNRYLNLIRKATPSDLKLRKKYMKQGVAEEVNPDITSGEKYFSGPTPNVRMGDFIFNASLDSGGYRDPNAKGLKITAYDPKNFRKIGWVDFIVHKDKKGNTWLESDETEVDDRYQRKGVATMMYAYAKSLGNDIKPSDLQSNSGIKMWKKWGSDAAHLVGEQGVAEEVNPEILSTKNSLPTENITMGDYEFNARIYTGELGNPGLQIRAYDPKKPQNQLIGHADFIVLTDKKGNTWLESDDTSVNPSHQGKGVAAMMYAFAKSLGNDIKPSDIQEPPGEKMWKKWGKDAKNLVGEQGVAEGYDDEDDEDDEAPYHTRILDQKTKKVIAVDGPYEFEDQAVDRAEAYRAWAKTKGMNIVAQVYQPAYGKDYVTWQVPEGDYDLKEQGVAENNDYLDE